jgi:N-acyl-D-aspartate/D-glutamate deacylase
MRMRMATVRLAIAAPLVAGMLAADARAQSLVIRGGTLIDGTGKPPSENAQILIRDGVIADVTSGGTIANADVIDASGKFIVPGFIDSHVHYRDWETSAIRITGRLRSSTA